MLVMSQVYHKICISDYEPVSRIVLIAKFVLVNIIVGNGSIRGNTGTCNSNIIYR